MRKINLIIIVTLLFQNLIFGQSASRYSNPNYMWTTLDENFTGTSLNPGVWVPMTHYKRGLGFLVNTPNTINVANDNLELKLQHAPNYLDSIWKTAGWLHVYSNYVGGEVTTVKTFHYGVFECRAKYAKQPGSWPAFWIIGSDGIPCPPGGYGNEIDMAEMFSIEPYPQMNHIIHRYYPPLNCDESNRDNMDGNHYLVDMNESYATYKCIWTPFKIEYYINDNLKHTVNNTGQDWYPSLYLNLKLSQQVCQPTNILGQEISPVAPQTSYFDYVKVREFFLAPEITSPSLICSTGTATLDVDTAATNIRWALTPSTLFVTSNGTEATAAIVKSSVTNGLGTITYSFQMPSGETFTASKDIWMGPYSSSNYPITGPSSAPCRQYVYYSIPTLAGVSSINWVWPSGWTYISGQNTANLALQTGTTGSGGIIGAQVVNICLNPGSYATMYTSVTGICGYSLFVSPNPATGEATIELVSDTKETLAGGTEWEFEVYDSMKGMKEKKTNIKTAQTKINTSSWKDGVYIVRAKIGDEVITEKLVVKH